MDIIGLVGFAGCGKDTTADILEDYGYKRVSFADTLKDVLASMFSWDRVLLEGKSPESRLWRETTDDWWNERLKWEEKYGFPFTPRVALQYFATDIIRKYFSDDFWIASLERKLDGLSNSKIVVTDCRFKNEMDMIKSKNGLLIRIKRGEDPSWFNSISVINQHNWSKESSNRLEFPDIGKHESEYSWIGYDFDYEIENNSLDSLKKQIEKIKGM